MMQWVKSMNKCWMKPRRKDCATNRTMDSSRWAPRGMIGKRYRLSQLCTRHHRRRPRPRHTSQPHQTHHDHQTPEQKRCFQALSQSRQARNQCQSSCCRLPCARLHAGAPRTANERPRSPHSSPRDGGSASRNVLALCVYLSWTSRVGMRCRRQHSCDERLPLPSRPRRCTVRVRVRGVVNVNAIANGGKISYSTG